MAITLKHLWTGPLCVLGMALISLSACGPAPRPSEADFIPEDVVSALDAENPIVARVNNTPIRLIEVRQEAESQLGVDYELVPGSAEYERILDELIDQRLLAQEARSRGLHRDAVAMRRIARAEERILGNVLLEKVIDDAVTEDAVREIYEQQMRFNPPTPEVRARHILVDTREEADRIKAALDAGGSFAELAITYSGDLATRLEGGDLGYFARDGILEEFGSIAFALDEGEISDPFPSEFGWHILMVVDRRNQPAPSLEALRPNIVRYSMFDTLEAMIGDLRETGRVQKPEIDWAAHRTVDEVDHAGDDEDEAG